jgi:hypothetical protein
MMEVIKDTGGRPAKVISKEQIAAIEASSFNRHLKIRKERVAIGASEA